MPRWPPPCSAVSWPRSPRCCWCSPWAARRTAAIAGPRAGILTKRRRQGRLTGGRLAVRLFTFGIPLVLGMFFHSLFNLADLIIVGKLGPYALAAVNQASLVGFVPMLFCTGVNTASIAVISRNFGMRNYRRANANTLQSFLLLLILSLALGVPSYLCADHLNRLVGSSGEALPAANDYLEISSAGLFTMFALMQVTAVLRAGGNARWHMILLIGANVLNVVLRIGLVSRTAASWAAILSFRLAELIELLGSGHAAILELQSILTALSHLPPGRERDPEKVAERYRETGIVRRRLAALSTDCLEVHAHVLANVETYNGTKGVSASFDKLDALLNEQSYRLASWRVASEEINYRRFFDVNELAAIRTEEECVFTESHRLIFRLLTQGIATGLRIDHVDGL